MINTDFIKRFTALQQDRNRIQTEYIKRGTIVDQSRERYAATMAELAKIGIGSLDELRSRIKSVSDLVEQELLKAEQQLAMIEAKLNEINLQKTAAPVSR